MNIPIFLISDENYAKYMAVTIASILYNTRAFVHFYVLDGGIHKTTKDRILKLKEKFQNFSLEFIKMDKSQVETFPDLNHFSLNTYLRYFIPELKPELKKVLYIDVDMVINCDVEVLYNIDLEGKSIGAIPYLFEYEQYPDDKWGIHIKNKFGMKRKSKYFNAGLLMLDCEKLRLNKMTKTMIDKTSELAEKLECPDQDVLNVLFENDYKELEYKYNVIVGVTGDIDKKRLDDIVESEDFILHYTGGRKDRPWSCKDSAFGNVFWEYAQMTPFCEDLRWELMYKEIDRLDNKINEKNNRKKYYFYKIMSKIAIGKKKQKYSQLKKEYKKRLKDV